MQPSSNDPEKMKDPAQQMVVSLEDLIGRRNSDFPIDSVTGYFFCFFKKERRIFSKTSTMFCRELLHTFLGMRGGGQPWQECLLWRLCIGGW